ncbi:MAG TPA: 2-hydroxy-3-oxopropionate reductase [Firmicutes bacterium]|nr:2-hydroxy-3-oxopropionate reductase [Bacillota bacterium]
MKPKVGFIGLGIMGKPMAKNVLKAGYELTVFNRTSSKTEELKRTGAKVASSPAQVARESDIVITMVSDSPDVREVVLGKNGIIEGSRPGLILIDMSTISPQVTVEINHELGRRGVEMLDAPVSGGEKGAIEGTLSIMVGGKKEVFERCLPILKSMGRKITHIGPSGAGQWAKLCNQVLASLNLLAVCEGLVLAAKAGLDINKVIEALSGGAAQSWALLNQAPKIVERDFSPGFLVKLHQKDLRLVLSAAESVGVSLPGTSLVHQLYNSIESEEGASMLGNHALIKSLEKLAGCEVKSQVSS